MNAFDLGFVMGIEKRGEEEATNYGPLLAEALLGPIGGGALGAVPALSPLVGAAGMVGNIGPAFTSTRSKDEQAAANEGGRVWMNAIPGVGAYNGFKRVGRTRADYEESEERKAPGANRRSQLVPEYLGQLTSSLGTAGVGALLGALLGKSDRGMGAAAGGLAGGVTGFLAHNIGAIVALMIKRRDTRAQMAYEANASTAKNLLVPGVAGFNMMKRLGYSAKYDAKKEKEQDGEKKASVGRGNKGETMSMLAYDIGLRLGFEKRAEDPGSILNDPRLAGALIGALGGGAVGAVLPGGKGKRGRRAATGALIGGLGGAGYGAFKNYQGSMQSRLAQEAQRAQMLEDGASDAADQYEMQLQSSEGERKRLADVMKQLEGRTIQQQELEQLKREAYDTVAQAGQLTDRATTAEATAAKAQRRAKLEAQLRDQQTTRPATTGDQLWVDTQNAAGKAMDTLDTVNQYRLLPARYATLPARVGATAVAKLIEAIKSMPKVEKPALRPARPEKKVTPKKY